MTSRRGCLILTLMFTAAACSGGDDASKGDAPINLPLASQSASGGGLSLSNAARTKADFNNDGYGDIAIGLPTEKVGTFDNAGAVQVIYGSADGLKASGDQFLTRDTAGVDGSAAAGEQFGAGLAALDMDHDGITDLAVGVPYDDFVATDEGSVIIFKGGTSGLQYSQIIFYNTVTPSQYQHACSWPTCKFGNTLAKGDFNNDDKADLAIGIPGAEWGDGSVAVAYGGIAGGKVYAGGRDGSKFGAAIAAGDHNADGYDDLMVGAPGAAVSVQTGAGAVFFYAGGSSGLGSTPVKEYSQEGSVPGDPEAHDGFGSAVTLGDADGRGGAELVVGVPNEKLDNDQQAGAVHVFSYDAPSTSRLLKQDSLSGGAASEPNDQFGASLASGDFNKDGLADLAIGSPYETIGETLSAGMIHVLYGSRTSGFAPDSAAIFHQGKSGVPGAVEFGDWFAISLSAWDFGKDAATDLAIGVPGESLERDGGTIETAGALVVLYGLAGTGLRATGAQIWTADTSGIDAPTRNRGQFGRHLV